MANGFRYRLNYIKLESMGIDVIMVWGCDIKRIIKDKIIEKEKRIISPIVFFLRQNTNNGDIILAGIRFL